MLDLNTLTVFLAIVEHGSFSEAGRRLNLSQSAVSQIVQGLERDLGVELFKRQSKSVSLTEAGQVLRPMAAELLNNARRATETMASMHGEVLGEMSIGCSTTSGKYLLPGLIARFRKIHPKVRINILVSSRDTTIRKLLSGDIPIGVSSKWIEHKELEYQEFFLDEVILIVPADHPWARYGRIFPDDLLDEPVILREEAAGTYEVMASGLRACDISVDMLNVAMTLGNAEAIEMAVEEGIGVSFVSRLAAQRGLELNRIAEVKVEGMELKRSLYMIRSRRIALSKSQSEFWNFMREGIHLTA